LKKSKVHGGTRKVLVRHENGAIANLPLAIRIIDLTLEAATKALGLPRKGEIQSAMEKAHPELLEDNLNWSAEFKKAGLSQLPDLPPWSKNPISKEIVARKKE